MRLDWLPLRRVLGLTHPETFRSLMSLPILSRAEWGARPPRSVDTNFGGVDTLTS